MSTHQPLYMHIPEPNARPGQSPDFSYLHAPAAGETRRPLPTAREADIRDLP